MIGSRRGHRLALLVLIVCLLPAASYAQNVTIAWDRSIDAAGYVVRWGSRQGVYPNSRDVGNVSQTDITGLTIGASYVVVVEAYDAEGTLSEPSLPLQFIAPGPPCVYSTDLTSTSLPAGAGGGRVTVTAMSHCSWTADTQSTFVTFNPSSGIGNAGTDFSVMQNLSSNPRTATATVAGQPLTVTQAAAAVDIAARDRENTRADFSGDGRSDLLLQDVNSGELRRWAMDGHFIQSSSLLSHRVADNQWRIAGSGDFNGDDKPDIVWHHQTQGWVFLWYMDGSTRIGTTYFSRDRVNPGWRIAAVGDINGDGRPDVVWQNNGEGRIAFWLMDGITVTGFVEMPIEFKDRLWRIAALADFNGDGMNDLVLRHTGYGEIGVWLMNGVNRTTYVGMRPGAVTNQNWQIAAVIDTNADNTPDIVWQDHQDGQVVIWYMNGIARMGFGSVPITLPVTWKIAGPK